ncbi:hypothetical protein K502DRAFT_324598 [Neoconidiobolus thromboides FSU 785]|nr:hypothetical protein K502DRAFT_324598 [Neoconidiobolus thromboides FSU 785]
MSKLFVGRLSKYLYQEPNLLKDYFSQFGEIAHIKPLKKFNPKRNQYGYYCFIRFHENEIAIKHILEFEKLHKHNIYGKQVDVGLSLDNAKKK